MRRPGTDDHLASDPHEQGVWEQLQQLCPADGVFVDVGAHVGRYSVRMARTVQKVFAVEPNPPSLDGLRENVMLNGLLNVEVVPYAASDRIGTVDLFDPKGVESSGSSYVVPGEMYRTDTLDRLIGRRQPRIDLMKIDVEGHEGAVLRGARGILDTQRPHLYIEMHDRMYGDQIRHDVLNELDRALYVWEEVYVLNDCWYLLAVGVAR